MVSIIRAPSKSIHLITGSATLWVQVAATTLLILASVAASSIALAGDLDKVVAFNIEGQTLGKALLQFGAQAHVQISFAWDSSIAELRTHELKGHYTGREALAELLKGTHLKYIANKQTIAILPIAPSRPAASVRPPEAANAPPGAVTKASYADKSQLSDPPAQYSTAQEAILSEVIITGSRLPTASKGGPQEVQIYDQSQIDQSGQLSVADFLSTLPSVSLTTPEFQLLDSSTTVTLRGLPVGTTLVLVNGRRLENSGTASGGRYFDLSNIPLAFVQRIEIDENGSSAVYGSDAIAGVVNIILKSDFDGLAASARYGWAKDVRTIQSSVAVGKQWSHGGISAIGSYEVDGGLPMSDRTLTANNDYTAYGGPDENSPLCFPANVFAPKGTQLPGTPPGTTATYAAVTGGATSGKASFSQFTYGALNECSENLGYTILPPLQRSSALIEGHLEFAPAVSLFTEIMYTHMDRDVGGGEQYLFGTPQAQSYTVSASNPFNPFGITVGVADLLPDAPLSEDIHTNFFRPLVGLKGTIANQWQWEVSVWQSTDWTTDVNANYFQNTGAIQAALNSSALNTALNPFVTGPVASPALLNSLFTGFTSETTGRDQDAETYIRGPIARLPAGEIEMAVGGDYVRSELHINNEGAKGIYASHNSISTYQRKYYAAFGEVVIPLIAGQSTSSDLANLTASARNDHYSDFGSDTTEQVGLEIRPVQTLLVRGTYGTAFAAPNLVSLFTPQTIAPTVVIIDPSTGNREAVRGLLGGNPELSPLGGHSNSVGVVYSSQGIPGLGLSVTQWGVAETNVIQAFSPQVIVSNAADFPGRVVRNSSGQIVEVNATQGNFGSINVDGLDYNVAYSHAVGSGSGSISLEATETYHYAQALVPGARPIESVSKAQDDQEWAPRWKGTAAVGWVGRSVNVHLDGRFVGPYQDYDTTRIIGKFWLVDGSIRWSIGRFLRLRNSYVGGTYLELGGTNLLNAGPQFSNYAFDTYGYDAAQMNIVGRSLYAEFGVNW